MAATEINAALLRGLRPEIEEALAAVGTRHGIKFKVGSGSYTDAYGSFKLELNQIAEDGKVQTKEAANFLHMANLLGFEPSDLGRAFVMGGKTYTLTGYKSGATRFPLIGRGADGRNFKFTTDAVLQGMKGGA